MSQLHAHLSGSISRQCLHEVWLMKKEAGETDLADPLVEMPDGKHDYNLKTYVNECVDWQGSVFAFPSLHNFHRLFPGASVVLLDKVSRLIYTKILSSILLIYISSCQRP